MGKPYLGYEESEAGLVGGLQGGPLSTGDMRVRNILNKWKTLNSMRVFNQDFSLLLTGFFGGNGAVCELQNGKEKPI